MTRKKAPLEIPTQQSCTMTYWMTRTALDNLEDLVINGGKRYIAGQYLECDGSTLFHYKGRGYTGANYAMPLTGVLQLIAAARKKL